MRGILTGWYDGEATTPVNERAGKILYVPESLSPDPLITVVTPTFNTGEILLETALSLLQQSYQQFRWIIVDDGSTDIAGVAAIQQELGTDPRIELHRLGENRGVSFARNYGVSLAHSPFIFFLDSDDLIEPTTLEKNLWFLLTHPDAAFSSGWELAFGANRYQNGFSFGARDRFLVENQKNITALLRRELFQQIRFDESNRDGLEDWEFWLAAAEAGFWGGEVSEFQNWYRWTPQWATKWSNWTSVDKLQLFRERLKERYPRAFAGEFADVTAESLPVVIPENSLLFSPEHRVVIVNSPEASVFDTNNTICFTFEPSTELEEIALRVTGDVFVLPRFLPSCAFESFSRYIVQSRSGHAESEIR